MWHHLRNWACDSGRDAFTADSFPAVCPAGRLNTVVAVGMLSALGRGRGSKVVEKEKAQRKRWDNGKKRIACGSNRLC